MKTTDFGFSQIPIEEKTYKVREVFTSVAQKYDLMNDLMSFGLHRLWKNITTHLAQIPPNARILDLAGGTADLALRMAKKLNHEGEVILGDINAKMLKVGRDKIIDAGLWQRIHPVQVNAEALGFPDKTFDIVTIAFGLRNVTHKDRALAEMHRVLKLGGQCLILEFSKVQANWLRRLYDLYSFGLLPKLGAIVADDPDSYQYLVESIRKHPDQQTLLTMMKTAGFEQCKIHNFLNGIVALHRGHRV